MGLRILLDTSAYSAWKRGHPQTTGRIRKAAEMVFSTIVLGELQAGFRRGTRLERNLAELEEVLGDPYVRTLAVTEVTADRYARIAQRLRDRGTPVPTNDIWIAAHSLESGTELLSFDAHFDRIEGLVWTHLKHS